MSLLVAALAVAPALAQTLPTVTMSPSTVTVEDEITLSFSFTVGAEPLATGTVLAVQDPVFHGNRWRWSAIDVDPANCVPGSTNLGVAVATAQTSSAMASLSVRRTTTTTSLHSLGVTFVTVDSGFMAPGEKLVLFVGDTSDNADCAFTVGPRAFRDVEWEVSIMRPGDAEGEPIDTLMMQIEEHATVSTVVVSQPSDGVVGESMTARVSMLDIQGNPVRDYTGAVFLTSDISAVIAERRHTFVPEDEGVWTVGVRPLESGVMRLGLSDLDSGVGYESNPSVVETGGTTTRIFWGDVHAHHGSHYTDDDGNLVDENHSYARDVMGYDVAAESVKAGSLELQSDELWSHLQGICESYTVDEEYVALLAFEWMGLKADAEGHHNVYYDGCTGPLGDSGMPGLADAADGVYAFQAEVEADYGLQSIVIPHATVSTGFNWSDQDDNLRTLAEIYSQGWGFSDEVNAVGSGVYDALGAGLRLGFMASSDNHNGWMGNSVRPHSRNDNTGLAAFVATDLSRAGIFDAMQSRSTYATTGQRSVLRFSVHDGALIEMGEEYIADSPTFSYAYSAVDEITMIELLAVSIDESGGYTVDTLERWMPGGRDAQGTRRVFWDGTRTAVWLHVIETSGHEAWSSPIWLTDDCSASGVVDPVGRCGP